MKLQSMKNYSHWAFLLVNNINPIKGLILRPKPAFLSIFCIEAMPCDIVTFGREERS